MIAVWSGRVQAGRVGGGLKVRLFSSGLLTAEGCLSTLEEGALVGCRYWNCAGPGSNLIIAHLARTIGREKIA